MAVNLADLDGAYEEATPMDLNGPPIGRYQWRIDEAHLKETQDGKNWMIALVLKVLTGPLKAGSKVFHNIFIPEVGGNFDFLKTDLHTLGYKGPLSQIESALDTFVDLIIEGQIKNWKNKQTNEEKRIVRMEKRIDISQVLPGQGGPEPDFRPPAEDIPPLEEEFPPPPSTNDF